MNRMPQHCAQCGGSMKNGFLRDLQQHRPDASFWVEGPIERSFFTGVKVRGRPRGEVLAFRCEGCGRLELYAPTLET